LIKEASESDDVQVLALDWSSIAQAGLDLPESFVDKAKSASGIDGSSPLSPPIPRQTAHYIAPVAQWAHESLNEKLGIEPNQLTLVGHSLGTYVSSEIARLFDQEDQEDQEVKNLVALDPAFPGADTSPLPLDVDGYDIDGDKEGQQLPAMFRDVATNSLAFVAKNRSQGGQLLGQSQGNSLGSQLLGGQLLGQSLGGPFGDSDKAATAHNSFVIDYPISNINPIDKHNKVVDVFTDALNKGHLELPNLTLPKLETGWYSDNGNKLNSITNLAPEIIKEKTDLNNHEGNIAVTSDGNIKHLERVVESSGEPEQAWT
jgi:pimeloyl-ACP methyl ester carboxylesterase